MHAVDAIGVATPASGVAGPEPAPEADRHSHR